MAAVSLFWNTNMAAVTSYENALYSNAVNVHFYMFQPLMSFYANTSHPPPLPPNYYWTNCFWWCQNNTTYQQRECPLFHWNLLGARKLEKYKKDVTAFIMSWAWYKEKIWDPDVNRAHDLSTNTAPVNTRTWLVESRTIYPKLYR